MTDVSEIFDAAVIGLGPAGLAAALALGGAGFQVALIGPVPTPTQIARDTRTTALFGGSIAFLKHIGVWPALADRTAMLKGLRIIDDTGGLLRAPEILFQASEVGRDAFGYNFDNAPLIDALLGAARSHPSVKVLAVPVMDIDPAANDVRLNLADGQSVRARLVVGADGRRSICRTAAGVREEAWTYPQSALATRFTHSRPHHGISTEFHRRHGPLTTVPLPGLESSLVWVDQPNVVERLMGLSDTALRAELELRLQGLLGGVGRLGPRAAFPLSGLSAKPVAQRRIALVGEAAHVLPPIGAQGLNLGFRDAAWIVEKVSEARAKGQDFGGAAALEAYCLARSTDIATRTMAIDLLNRSLFSGLLPVDVARGAGLALLKAVPFLRHLVMREGIEPSGRQPRLLTEPVSVV